MRTRTYARSIAVTSAALVALSACSAGRVTQTATQERDKVGAMGQVGDITVRAATFESPREGSYEAVHHEGEESTAYEQTLSRSFLVSADMAHAVHPNYAGKYEPSHQPAMNKGTVIKINANQRYATNSPGIVLVQECARLAGVPLQLFVVRNDSPCGSTIGPGLAAKLGMRTLDLGNPQLSMHSIRETGGTADVEHAVKLFDQFFESYGRLEPKILVD